MLYMISSRYLYSIRECWTCKSLNETTKCEIIFLKSNKSLSHWSMDGEDEIHPGLSPLAPWLRLVRCSLPSFNHSITLSSLNLSSSFPFLLSFNHCFTPSLLQTLSPFPFPLSSFLFASQFPHSFQNVLTPLSIRYVVKFSTQTMLLQQTWWCEQWTDPSRENWLCPL